MYISSCHPQAYVSQRTNNLLERVPCPTGSVSEWFGTGPTSQKRPPTRDYLAGRLGRWGKGCPILHEITLHKPSQVLYHTIFGPTNLFKYCILLYLDPHIFSNIVFHSIWVNQPSQTLYFMIFGSKNLLNCDLRYLGPQACSSIVFYNI